MLDMASQDAECACSGAPMPEKLVLTVILLAAVATSSSPPPCPDRNSQVMARWSPNGPSQLGNELPAFSPSSRVSVSVILHNPLLRAKSLQTEWVITGLGVEQGLNMHCRSLWPRACRADISLMLESAKRFFCHEIRLINLTKLLSGTIPCMQDAVHKSINVKQLFNIHY